MMKKPFLLWTAACLFFVCCQANDHKTPLAASVTPITTAYVKDTAIQTVVDIAGEVFPKSNAIVFSQVPGRVDSIKVKAGERVNANQVIAVVMQEISGSDFKPCKVKTPMRGVVLRKMVDVGNYVSVQNPLFEIGDISLLYFRGQVFGESLTRVKTGQNNAITGDTRDTIAVITVTLVSPQFDPVTGGLAVEGQVCKVPGITLELKPGQSVDGHIIIGPENGLRVPRISVVTIPEKGTGVYLIEKNKARFQVVEITSRSEEFFLITGVKPGDLIARDGADKLADNQRVNITKEK